MHLGSGLRGSELGLDAGRGHGQKGGGSKAEKETGPLNASRDTRGKGKKK
jgi:hypothetical protein